MKHPAILIGRLLLGSAVALVPVISVAQSSGSAGSMIQSGATNQSGTNQDKQNAGTTMSADKKFMRDAAQGGMAEVELGKLATEKASSDDVKRFGQRMVDDHSKANDELKQIASSEGVTLPDTLNAKDKALKVRLSKLSGENFDRAYMESMVKDHKKDVADFQKESASGSDPQVKQFASKTLPTLQDHLQQAQSIAPNTKMSGNMGSQSMQ
jgi:putative membrane protein